MPQTYFGVLIAQVAAIISLCIKKCIFKMDLLLIWVEYLRSYHVCSRVTLILTLLLALSGALASLTLQNLRLKYIQLYHRKASSNGEIKFRVKYCLSANSRIPSKLVCITQQTITDIIQYYMKLYAKHKPSLEGLVSRWGFIKWGQTISTRQSLRNLRLEYFTANTGY